MQWTRILKNNKKGLGVNYKFSGKRTKLFAYLYRIKVYLVHRFTTAQVNCIRYGGSAVIILLQNYNSCFCTHSSQCIIYDD